MTPRVRNTIIGGIVSIAALIGQAQGDEWKSVEFFVLSRGNHTCGEFLQVVDGEHQARPRNFNPTAIYTMQYVAYEEYSQGFLTGANWASAMRDDSAHAQVGSGAHDAFAGPMAWLENYCRQNPLHHYIDALAQLRDTLAAKGQQ
jgi:hypothetical protein